MLRPLTGWSSSSPKTNRHAHISWCALYVYTGRNAPGMHHKGEITMTAKERIRKADLNRRIIEIRRQQRELEKRYNHHHDPKTGRFTSANGLTSGSRSSIIKSITIKDFDAADKAGIVSKECRETIINTLKEQGVYEYDEIRMINIPPDKDGRIEPMRTNAVVSPGYPKVYLEINEAFFADMTKDQIDDIFKRQNYCAANSLEEAVIHECGHAKVIHGRRYAEYKAIDDNLQGDIFTKSLKSRDDGKSLKDIAGEISDYAQTDGLECIAECHVKLNRGETIPEELKALYDKYVR